jgi:translation initiation factor 2B subunit (eIF-2B alpha/beta/delta family)
METRPRLPRQWLLRALDLETDRQGDAARLAREAVRAFRDAAEEAWTPEADPGQVRALLDAYGAKLRRAAPGATDLPARLDRCLAAADRGREAVLAETDAILAEAEGAGKALIEAAADLFRPGARVVTLGHSESVRELLTRCSDRLESVTVSEGRPRCEGVRLAAAIGELAVPVRLITEAQLDIFLPECDLAVQDVERVLPGGSVVGNAGTALLARLCAAHGVPFYLLAERSKWVPEKSDLAAYRRERRSPGEVLADPVLGVEVANVAFDLTPAGLVAGFVTEEGVQPAGLGSSAVRLPSLSPAA